MRVLAADDVLKVLTPGLAIRSAEQAFAAFSGGSAQIPPRSEIHRTDPEGTALIMSGLIGNSVLGVKLVGSMDSASDPGARSTTCIIMIWDAATLTPRALISADRLNDYRTAAALAVGTRLLARPDSSVHAIFGTGKLALPSAFYVSQVRPIRRLIIVGRTPANVAAMAGRLAADPAFKQVEIVTNLGPDEAVAAADIVTTVTRSSTPLFDGSKLRDGTHINLGGAMRKDQREMDDRAAARSIFYVDSRQTCLERAGDIVQPLASKAISQSQIIGEIGEVILGRIAGRSSDSQITVFRSMGIAAQDLCLADLLAKAAEERGIGRIVAL